MLRNRRDTPPAGPDVAVASRRAALETLAAITTATRSGPVLLTGEPGAGKSWLRRLLVRSLPSHWGATVVAAAPALDAVDFLTLTAAALGVSPQPDRPATLRLAVEAALADEALDGRRRLLVVEDAHHAGPDVWAEVEAVCDRLGEPGGFAAAVVVGRGELVRRLASPPSRSLASRLSKHLHLPPLNVDEAAALLPGVPDGALEVLHRDAAGNPRRLLALAADRVPAALAARPVQVAAPVAEAPPPLPSFPSRAPEPAPPVVVPVPGAPKVAAPAPRQSPPALLPSRPPLRVEEGLIEVGWAGGPDVDEDAVAVEADDEAEAPSSDDGELIDDHYAALQAWTEWARNRDRLSRPAEQAAAGEPAAVPDDPAGPDDDEADADVDVEREPLATSEGESALRGDLRAEPAHEHAPYGQLFGKTRTTS